MNRRPGMIESLSGDFAALVLLVAIFASTVFTGAEVYTSYRQIEFERAVEIRRIESRFVSTLAQSIWKLDLLQAAMQLELLASSDVVHHVQVASDVAGLSYQSAYSHPVTLPTSTFNFDIVYQTEDGIFDLGVLEVGLLDPWELLRIREQLSVAALFEFAKIGLLMLAVYLASRFYLTQPLHRLRTAVDAIDPGAPGTEEQELLEVSRERNNEIGALAEAFAQLLERTRVEMKQRARSQHQLALSLKEKELLLREVHHRVKNNLQLVVSMLALQRRQHQRDEVDRVLASAQNRVYSMSLVHQLLHREEGLQHLDLQEYLSTLVRELVIQNEGPLETTVRGDSAHLLADQAIPLGLIVTELVLNSMKHAFPDGRNGRIDVEVKTHDGNCEILVTDNGVGFVRSASLNGEESLGMRLVEALAEQISATVTRSGDEGTRYTLRFSLAE